jgi:hypothetical protein
MNKPYSEPEKPVLALYSNNKEDSITINNNYVDKGIYQMRRVNSSHLSYINHAQSTVHGEHVGLTKQAIITNINHNNKTGTDAN